MLTHLQHLLLCGVLDHPLQVVFSRWFMFSAMPKAKCKEGVAARSAFVRRSARSVPTPSRLGDDDDGGLHRQIAELQAQRRRVTARPDAVTASTSAFDADVTELPAMSAAQVPGAHSPVNLTPDSVPGPPTNLHI